MATWSKDRVTALQLKRLMDHYGKSVADTAVSPGTVSTIEMLRVLDILDRLERQAST